MKFEMIKNSDKNVISCLFNPLQSLLVNTYSKNDEIVISSYKYYLLELATFLKLHSAAVCDLAVDCVVVDAPENEYRFTITYIIQSTLGNKNYYLITKTDNNFPIFSLQGVYPAFN